MDRLDIGIKIWYQHQYRYWKKNVNDKHPYYLHELSFQIYHSLYMFGIREYPFQIFKLEKIQIPSLVSYQLLPVPFTFYILQ